MSPTGTLLAAAREKQLYQLKQWGFLLNFSVVEEPILVTREPSEYSIFSWEDRLDSAQESVTQVASKLLFARAHAFAVNVNTANKADHELPPPNVCSLTGGPGLWGGSVRSRHGPRHPSGAAVHLCKYRDHVMSNPESLQGKACSPRWVTGGAGGRGDHFSL